jgi:two-component system, LuxR family, sensor kinase FixL
MSWITIAWSMAAAVCLTLAGMYLLVWWNQRDSRVHLIFSINALGVAAFAAGELAMMRAQTPQEFGNLLRWIHVPALVIVVTLVWFIRLYLHAGRRWLAWSICGLRALALILNFVFTPNLNFRQITGIRHLPWWGGEMISTAVGVVNPWTLIGQASLFLVIVFTADATLTVWRRGERRRALIVGGSILFFVTAGTGQAVLIVWGIVDIPFFITFAYLGIVAVMAFELSKDMWRAAQVAVDLQASEAILREQEQRLDLAASSAGIGLWMWDIPRNQIWITDQGRAIFGFAPAEDIAPDQFRNRVHPEDREGMRATAATALQTRTGYEIEYRILRPDGEIRWISGRGRVECAADGKPVRMRGVSIDITDRKRAEEKFRVAVEASPIGIVLVNEKGLITLVNSHTEKLFGYQREELIDQPVEILVPKRFRAAHPGHRAGFLTAPRARAMGAGRELYALRKDGTEFPVEIGISPMQTSEGTIVLGTIVDISARKQAELDVQRHRGELTHLSRVSLMGELSASLAHELNQPLAGIISNAGAGQRFIDAGKATLPEIRELLSDISADGHRASDVVRGIRKMVKKSDVVRQSMSLNDVVLDVVQIARTDALLRSCEVELALNPDLPLIQGDPVQLRQVLLNLVVNAFDAMRDTPVADRKVLIMTDWNRNGTVRTSVHDRGCGLSEETRARLFDPFFTTRAEGLGMGLAIVRSIVESHGGTIAAENREGGGAHFHFTIAGNSSTSE